MAIRSLRRVRRDQQRLKPTHLYFALGHEILLPKDLGADAPLIELEEDSIVSVHKSYPEKSAAKLEVFSSNGT